MTSTPESVNRRVTAAIDRFLNREMITFPADPFDHSVWLADHGFQPGRIPADPSYLTVAGNPWVWPTTASLQYSVNFDYINNRLLAVLFGIPPQPHRPKMKFRARRRYLGYTRTGNRR